MPLALSFFFCLVPPLLLDCIECSSKRSLLLLFFVFPFFSPHILVCLPLSLLNLRYLVVDHASLFFLSLVSPRDVRVLLRRCSPTFECVCARVGASAVMWSIQRPSCCSAVGAARPTVDRFSFLFFLFCYSSFASSFITFAVLVGCASPHTYACFSHFPFSLSSWSTAGVSAQA